jgi:uroporphyrin-III C-methyltransferase/precorrin-2 dehydrogenase/sirohydrochlorin ferrochelatase
MDQFMPAIPLAGARVVVIGAGEAALNKLRLFRTAPCTLVWCTLGLPVDIPGDLNPHARIIADAKADRHLKGAKLVFIGLENQKLARRYVRKAKAAGALVNVVDDLPLCDFYTPALIDRGAVTVAFSTGGSAPVLARDLRSLLETSIPKGIGHLADAAASLRDQVKEAFPTVDARRRFWERALRGSAAQRADAGDEAGARAEILEDLRRTTAPESVRNAGFGVQTVHLVGAGPGDPELLTVKAARLIRDAEVIVHDRLVSPEIIDRARRDAIRIDVGKTAGHHPTPQSRICEILIEQARLGRRVVRLKGGDSFIFGRGGEEAEAVRAAGVPVEVTPGVSAALAAGANAQIPLTHRDAAQAVTFVTGRPKTGGPGLDYDALAAATHTLVIYMGVATAATLSRRLIEAGRAPDTPVAVVEHASLPAERTVFTTLEDLAPALTRAQITGPSAIVVGEVVRRAPGALAALSAQARLEAAA